MGAAWRSPKQKDSNRWPRGCARSRRWALRPADLGLLREGQAEELKAAGLDYLQPQPRYGPRVLREIITTRTYRDRLDTLARVRRAGSRSVAGGSWAWASRARSARASSPSSRA